MVLVFEIYGDIAMFRKPYTTTSMVSFPFPPPTAVAGIIGAIIGLQHGANINAKNASYWGEMDGSQIAVGIRKPITWMITSINLMKFKSSNAFMGEHIQVKHQFVKKPRYRIYLRGGKLYNELKRRLEKGEFAYTPYLGVGYALADISFVGEYDEKDIDCNSVALDTVLPYYSGMKLDIVAGGNIHRETVPFRADELRKLQDSVLVFYPEYSRNMPRSPQIVLREKGSTMVSKVGTEKVAWFNAW